MFAVLQLREMDSKLLVLLCVLALFSLSVEGIGNIFGLQSRETDFYLFTPRGPTNGERISANSKDSIISTTFDPDLRLAVIVHGYLQNGFKPWISKMRKELMKREKMNVIVVDWETRAGGLYDVQAVPNTRVVGRQIANLVKKLHSSIKFRFSLTKVHVIGHSLGAHVAGFAGAELLRMSNHTKLGRITGLDPARPGFDVASPHERLDPSDAEFVDVIHTDAGYNYLEGGLGIERISGHVDFYPNGGSSQPGCINIVTSVEDQLEDIPRKLKKLSQGRSGFPRAFACDHMKVVDYFTSSINHQCSRKAFPCVSWEAFKQGRCYECEGACPEMGYDADQYHVNGSHKYYLSTYNKKGYCAPRYYVSVVLSGLRIKRVLRTGFSLFDSMINSALDTAFNTVKSRKIGISLVMNDSKTIQMSPSDLEDASQVSRLVLSDHQPGPLTAIELTYSGNQDTYIDKATVRHKDNTYTACFKKWMSTGFFRSHKRYRASLRKGDHGC